ncbi:MAG: hypothetical protein AAF591_13025 [Verrucomicrobiota bacterium]
MLREIRCVRQVPGEPFRRWFRSEAIDLFVWFGKAGEVVGLRFCYEDGGKEGAVSWWEGGSVEHRGIDDGERGPGCFKQTPILAGNAGLLDERVVRLFATESEQMDGELAMLVGAKLRESARGPVRTH